MNTLPRQKVTSQQRTEQWKKDTLNAIIDMSDFGHGFTSFRTGSDSNYKALVQKCYDYYNGNLDPTDYTRVTKPFGKDRPNFPARLQNYNILKPIIDVLIGEKWKRPVNPAVSVLNPDVTNKRVEALRKQVRANLEAQFLNNIAQGGQIPTTEPPQEVPSPEQVAENFVKNYRDGRAVLGQQSLRYIKQTADMEYKLNTNWFHWLMAGLVFSKRGVGFNDPEFEILNPLECDGDKDPNIEFFEDGNWAVHRTIMHRSRVVDNFWDLLTDAEITELEKVGDSNMDGPFSASSNLNTGDVKDTSHYVEVIYVTWKGMKKVGIVSYVDEIGLDQEKIVDEDYKEAEGEKVEWHWESVAWEGYRINKEMFKRVQELPVQRRRKDNRGIKLPINGRRYSAVNTEPVSLMMMLLAYQVNYNIYKYRLENMIAKSKGVVAVFDINMLPAREGWDMDKFMYYLDATGIAWVDYNKEGIRLNHQQQTVLDMTIKVLDQYVTILDSIVAEAESTSGVSRQRKGATSPYEGKGVTQQSIIQSSHITEDLFKKYDKYEEREYQAVVDYSKPAWVDGKRASYVLPDNSHDYFEVDPIEYSETEYGIYITTSVAEQEKIQQVRSIVQAMAQNGASFTTLIEAIEADSMPELKEKMKAADEAAQKLQQAQQQAEQQMVQQQQQAEQMKIENENAQKELDRNNKLQIAQIQQDTSMQIAQINAASNSEGDNGSANDTSLEREKMRETNRLKEKEINTDREVDMKKLDLEKVKLDEDVRLREKEIDVKEIVANKPRPSNN